MGVRLTTAADPLICIGLLRSRRDFSTRDLALLTILSPHLMQAYHNAAAVTRLQDRMAAGENELMIRRQGFASVTEDGHIRFATPSAERLMTRYDAEAKRDRGSLPLSLRRWFLQELHRHASECLLQQPSRPFHIKRDDGVLLVRLLRHTPNTVLLFEESASPRAGHLRETFRLSDREAQVLEWVIQGKTNPEIGTILSISHRTVQKHLERIYTHLGVENRHAAISLVLSLRSSPEESHPPWNI
ncbi:MAG: helix-turn-helix transcriptional regulator [Nitrospira sp.]|nr:helix-turn-helix transcriptional regulator [Nitrospira sp.]